MLPVQILQRRIRRRERLRQFNLERIHLRNVYNPFELEDLEFKKRFRLSKLLAQELIEELLPWMRNSNRVQDLTPQLRVFVTLAFLATGSYQRVLGTSHNLAVSQQSVSKCIKEVVSIITDNLAHNYIRFPRNNEEKQVVKLGFHQKFNFPGVVGAIDCTHVKILTPAQEEHNYLNRKGFHSINVQMICDSNLVIIAVNPQHAGATHDSFIWNNSIIYREMERNYRNGDNSSWLLGDSGYPLQPWLMTPVLNVVRNTPESRYTACHSTARNTIERCFGVLKQRFRCLLAENTLRYKPEIAAKIVSTCAVLHNKCIHANFDLNLDQLLPAEADLDMHFNPLPQDRRNPILVAGERIRGQIIQRYFS